jgi:hypothetical protein
MTAHISPPINRYDPPMFDRIASHYGHAIEVAAYGDDEQGTVNVAIECVDCSEVIIDQERYPEARA